MGNKIQRTKSLKIKPALQKPNLRKINPPRHKSKPDSPKLKKQTSNLQELDFVNQKLKKTIQHDIKNNIHIIRGFANLVKSSCEDPEMIENINIIIEESDKTLQNVNKLDQV